MGLPRGDAQAVRVHTRATYFFLGGSPAERRESSAKMAPATVSEENVRACCNQIRPLRRATFGRVE